VSTKKLGGFAAHKEKDTLEEKKKGVNKTKKEMCRAISATKRGGGSSTGGRKHMQPGGAKKTERLEAENGST